MKKRKVYCVRDRERKEGRAPREVDKNEEKEKRESERGEELIQNNYNR